MEEGTDRGGREETFSLWPGVPAGHKMAWIRFSGCFDWKLPSLLGWRRYKLFVPRGGCLCKDCICSSASPHVSSCLSKFCRKWMCQARSAEGRGPGRLSAASCASRRVDCGVKVHCRCEFSFSVTWPAVWFPKQLAELLVNPHIHLKEVGLSPSNLLIIFLA